jgi:proteasome lid subunit RPN8/RPN11
MLDSNKALAIAHAKDEFPREACGLLVIRKGHEVYAPCRNIAVGTDQFAIHPEDYAAADEQGEIVGVVHSHPNGAPTPSQADRVACEASGLPWHIVGIPSEAWASIAPPGYKAPLVGREWSHGVLDCYAIICDWYQQERGITLLDFERHDDWWHNGGNLYADNYGKAGFVAVSDDLQAGDVLLMQIMSPVTNHAAIYLGDGLILHHLQGRLSSRDVYGGYWQKHTTHVLRYVNGNGSSSR